MLPEASLAALFGGSRIFLSSADLTLTTLMWMAQLMQYICFRYIFGISNSLKKILALMSRLEDGSTISLMVILLTALSFAKFRGMLYGRGDRSECRRWPWLDLCSTGLYHYFFSSLSFMVIIKSFIYKNKQYFLILPSLRGRANALQQPLLFVGALLFY